MSSVTRSRGLSVALMCTTFFAADAADNDTATCGGTANGAPCVFPFEYDGANYSQCTTVDDNQPWCITDDGIWGYCRCEGRRFAVGDRVRVKASVQTPMTGWGKTVTHQSIGVVAKVIDVNMGVKAGLFVDFPEQTNWIGAASEMEIVSKAPTAAPFLAPTPAPTEAVMMRSSACFFPLNSLGYLRGISWAECLYRCKQDSRCHGVSHAKPRTNAETEYCGLSAIAADPDGDGPYVSVADPLVQMPCQTNNTWTAYDRRYELPPAAPVAVGAQVRVKEDFWSLNGHPERLHQGYTGLVMNIDPEGDAQIKFNAYSVQQWVHMSNFVLLEVVQASFSPQELAEAQKHVEDLFKTLMSAACRDVTGLALAAALAVTMASVW